MGLQFFICTRLYHFQGELLCESWVVLVLNITPSTQNCRLAFVGSKPIVVIYGCWRTGPSLYSSLIGRSHLCARLWLIYHCSLLYNSNPHFALNFPFGIELELHFTLVYMMILLLAIIPSVSFKAYVAIYGCLIRYGLTLQRLESVVSELNSASFMAGRACSL